VSGSDKRDWKRTGPKCDYSKDGGLLQEGHAHELRTEKVCMYFGKETTSAERNPEVSIAQKGNEVRRLACIIHQPWLSREYVIFTYFPSHSEYSNTGLPVM
jgi:hypothetical protein